jgi:8-oxo-dGTP diphosphatase
MLLSFWRRRNEDGGFRGAKVLLFLGSDILVLRRDLRDDIPWPGALDFPGGGREGDETPVACALRETEEETGLRLDPSDLVWRKERRTARGRTWFFAAHIDPSRADQVRIGQEGSEWILTAPRDLFERGDTIPHFMQILRGYLDERDFAERGYARASDTKRG